ncbi:MAG: hemerythrin domain-containing protein [Ginsengibacter sp.]
MDTKPIKRSEEIAKLSRDHHVSLLFCWKIRNGIKKNAEVLRMKNYVSYFLSEHMGAHFREEEDYLFAPVKDEKVQRALDEHIVILNLTDKILNAGEPEKKDLLNLAQLVDDHVRYEERILFPHLENVLSAEQLKEIGKQLPDHLSKDTFEDKFW